MRGANATSAIDERRSFNAPSALDKLIQRELNDGTNKFIANVGDLPLKYNSLNIIVGKQGTSKTTSFLKLMMQLGMKRRQNGAPMHNYHAILYVTDRESDNSFDKLSKYVRIPIVKCNYESFLNVFNEITEAKEIYRQHQRGDVIPDAVMDKVLRVLRMDAAVIAEPQTMVFCDDAVFIFEDGSRKDELARQMTRNFTQLRHLQCTFFIAIQIWKSISRSVKTQLSTVWICGGFDKQTMQYIYRQISCPITFEQLWGEYIRLGRYKKLVIDCVENTIDIQ